MKTLVFLVFVFASAFFSEARVSNKSFEEEYQECKSMYDELERSNQLHSTAVFSLAHKLKEIMELGMSPTFTNKFNNLKKKLPRVVRVIIWKKNILITNKQFKDEYLYASYDSRAYSGERRNVYVWRNNKELPMEGEWEFGLSDDKKTFSIKTNIYNEYMYSPYTKLRQDVERRFVFTWRAQTIESDCWWIIEILNDNEIKIRSSYNYEYLYAAANNIVVDDYRRKVFTWSGSSPSSPCDDDACIWILK